MKKVPNAFQGATAIPILWSGQALFWPKLVRRLTWASFAAMFGLALLSSVSIFHNPLDVASFEQFCPANSVNFRQCHRRLVLDGIGAIIGIGIVGLAVVETMNIAFRAGTRRPIETYRLDRTKLHIEYHLLLTPSVDLLAHFLSFERKSQVLNILGFTPLGIRRTAVVGPLETRELQALITSLNALKDSQ